jgi:hypothetical protein
VVLVLFAALFRNETVTYATKRSVAS